MSSIDSTNPANRKAKKAVKKEWRLLLIDDHPMIRRGVRETLENERDLNIVDEASTEAEALDKARSTAPDLAVTDISLENGSGLELIKQLRSQNPDLRILVLSIHDEELYAERTLRAGANGYIQKSEPADQLIKGIRTALTGGTALSPRMTDRLVQQAVTTDSNESKGVEGLSDRELEVFHQIGSGLGTRQIAERMCISIKTVETHRENIKKKLGIHSAAELSRYAVT